MRKRCGNAAADAEEEEQEGEEAAAPVRPPVIPTLFRWVSSSKPDAPVLSFSVPPSMMPEMAQAAKNLGPPPPRETPTCDVRGCSLPRKYKLVKDPSKGGCGLEHLKALQVG